MNNRELNILISPGFLAGLFLLLLNDFLLKQLFHNWLTGKLSDFAGLFVFSIFWAALLPQFKRKIFLLTAIFFVFWKSAYSQPLIDSWNQWLFLPIGRTVDLTDLLALLILPVAYLYRGVEHKASFYRFAPHFIACVSLFAFTATSALPKKLNYEGKEYAAEESKNELIKKAKRIDERDDSFYFEMREDWTNPLIQIKADFCNLRVARATVQIEDKAAGSVITLKEISYDGEGCDEPKDDKERLLAIFERAFINKLRSSEPPVNNSSKPTPR